MKNIHLCRLHSAEAALAVNPSGCSSGTASGKDAPGREGLVCQAQLSSAGLLMFNVGKQEWEIGLCPEHLFFLKFLHSILLEQ